MRWLRSVTVAAVVGGLMTYQAIALGVAFFALVLSAVVLRRQLDQEGRLAALEREQLKRAQEQGKRLDELGGG